MATVKTLQALGHAIGIGFQPAVHKAIHTEMARHGALGFLMAEGLQAAAVVARPKHGKGHVLGARGMQIEQDFMLCQKRAQPVGNVILELGRRNAGSRRLQVAIEIAVTVAALQRIGLRIGDRHEGHAAAREGQRTALDLGDHAANAVGTGHLVAMHGAGDDQALAGFGGGE